MSREYHMGLLPEDNAILFTDDGDLIKGVTHRPEDLEENADALQEMMCEAFKRPAAKQGVWVWKIKSEWTEVMGWHI